MNMGAGEDKNACLGKDHDQGLEQRGHMVV